MDSNKNKIQVMIVYAVDFNSKRQKPWIYGAYTDHRKGVEVQDTMADSEEYGHLYWSNNVVLLDKEFNIDDLKTN